jgi:hypothetical protein
MSGYDYALGAATKPKHAVPPKESWWIPAQRDRETFNQAVLDRLPAMQGSSGDKVTKASLIAPWPTKRHPVNRVGRAKS